MAVSESCSAGTSMLLRLPTEVLQRIVVQAGVGGAGAYASCKELRTAWKTALSSTSTASLYFISRYSRSRTACVGAYSAALGHIDVVPLERGGSKCHGARVLALLLAMCQRGGSLSPPILLLAARAGHLPVVRHVLTSLATSLSPTDLAKSVQDAAGHGHCDVVAELLASATPGDHAAADESCALHAAARGPKGRTAVRICKVLLAGGASARTLGGSRALLAAVDSGNEELAQLLLEAGADAAAFDSAALQAACEQTGSSTTSSASGDNGGPSDSSGTAYGRSCGRDVNSIFSPSTARLLSCPPTVQLHVCPATALRMMELLLAAGADPCAAYSRPLYTVAERRALEALRLLLATNAYDRDAKSRAMRAASRMGAAAAVGMLLDAGADLHSMEADGQSALDLALRQGALPAAMQLLAAGYDLGNHGRAVKALVAAARCGEAGGDGGGAAAGVALMRQAGVDVGGACGGEALLAAAKSSGGAVRALAAAGVGMDQYGARALVEACCAGRVGPAVEGVVQALLQAGAAQGAGGRSAATQALEAAVLAKNAGCVRELLRAANVDRSSLSDRAMRTAHTFGFGEVLRLLHAEPTAANAAAVVGGSADAAAATCASGDASVTTHRLNRRRSGVHAQLFHMEEQMGCARLRGLHMARRALHMQRLQAVAVRGAGGAVGMAGVEASAGVGADEGGADLMDLNEELEELQMETEMAALAHDHQMQMQLAEGAEGLVGAEAPEAAEPQQEDVE